MLVPLNWLSEFVSLGGLKPSEIAEKLVSLGFEVEKIIDQREFIKKVFVGRITYIKRHQNADRLQICKIAMGKRIGVLQIVTGARNVEIGNYVPVCIAGARLPDGKEILPSELRGVRSDGMLAGGSELGLTEADYPGDRKSVV